MNYPEVVFTVIRKVVERLVWQLFGYGDKKIQGNTGMLSTSCADGLAHQGEAFVSRMVLVLVQGSC